MLQPLLFFTISPILDLTAARSLHNSASVPVAQLVHTNQNCSSGQYEFHGNCCDFCKPGSVAKSLGCTENPKTNCKPCTEGKDYMDKDNYKTTCLRCGLCDEQHGMEIEKNCTITQNVKCRCRIGFFCSLTKPCRHCEKCDQCENEIIAKECTPTQNTVCGRKDNLLWLWSILLIVPVIVGLVLWWRCCPECRIQRKSNIPSENYELYKRKEPEYPDTNLKPYIPEIVCDMEVKQVKILVRRLGVHTAQIDEIVNDNLHESSEQKIKLLECWQENHGIKNSVQTLMTGLEELRFNDVANKVDQLLKRNHPED